MTGRTKDVLFLYGLVLLFYWLVVFLIVVLGIRHGSPKGNAEVTGLLEVPAGCNAAGACWDTAYEVHTTLGTVETDYDTFRRLDMNDRVTVENGELK